jgi:hypothetical protein
MEGIEAVYRTHRSLSVRNYLSVGVTPINTLLFFDRGSRGFFGSSCFQKCTSLTRPDALEVRGEPLLGGLRDVVELEVIEHET